MSEHYQKKFTCSKCQRNLIVDIMSYGTSHQQILAVTCEVCATNIMGDKVEHPVRKDAVSDCCGSSIMLNNDIKRTSPFYCNHCGKDCQIKQMHDTQILKA